MKNQCVTPRHRRRSPPPCLEKNIFRAMFFWGKWAQTCAFTEESKMVEWINQVLPNRLTALDTLHWF